MPAARTVGVPACLPAHDHFARLKRQFADRTSKRRRQYRPPPGQHDEFAGSAERPVRQPVPLPESGYRTHVRERYRNVRCCPAGRASLARVGIGSVTVHSISLEAVRW